MKFNTNDHVWVRLTERGREILRQPQWVMDVDGTPFRMQPHGVPEETAQGYSKWTLWDLMSRLGPFCEIGFNPPFETELELVEK